MRPRGLSVRPFVGPSVTCFFQGADYDAPNSSTSLPKYPEMSKNIPKCPIQTHCCPNVSAVFSTSFSNDTSGGP